MIRTIHALCVSEAGATEFSAILSLLFPIRLKLTSIISTFKTNSGAKSHSNPNTVFCQIQQLRFRRTLVPNLIQIRIRNSVKSNSYCAYHGLVPPNFRRYYFYFLSDQAQILLDHLNVLDELWCQISFKSEYG